MQITVGSSHVTAHKIKVCTHKQAIQSKIYLRYNIIITGKYYNVIFTLYKFNDFSTHRNVLPAYCEKSPTIYLWILTSPVVCFYNIILLREVTSKYEVSKFVI